MINNPILMDGGVYVWEKYDVIVDTYKKKLTSYSNGIGSSPGIPSDADSSVKYSGYSFDTTTGTFTMTGAGASGKSYYYPSTQPNKIYDVSVTSGSMSGNPGSWNVYKITAVIDTSHKGETCYGTVTAEDEAAYPADGEQDGYWYVLVGKTGAEGGGDSPVLQVKSVTPSEASQNVMPDAGYDGLSKVTVGAIQTETKTVTSNGTVTPSSGKYLKQVTVNVPTSGLDTSDATATAGKILKGATAYVKGKKVTGTIEYYPNGSSTSYGYVTDGAENVRVETIQSKKYLDIKSSTIVNPVAFLADSKVSCGTLLSNLGDASASDVAQGKTFTSAAGLKVTGTHVCSGGINTSDATATADDMAEGVTAYVKGEKITGNVKVFDSSISTILSSEDRVYFTVFQTKKYIQLKPAGRTNNALFRSGTYQALMAEASFFGDATASDVAEGKTFTSTAGLKVTGTAKASTPTLQSKTVSPSTSQQIITPDSGYDGLSQITVEAMPSGSLSTPTISSSGLITAKVGTSGYLASGTSATKQLTTQAAKTVTPTASEQTVVNSAVYTTGAVKVAAVPSETKTITANGTYTPSSGKFFSSVTVNVPSSSSGGSSDNNCEAYHITSTSDTISFKGSGTVKVWGYGYKSGSYMGTQYSFVGDGYYSGSYGTPSKTTASFSINADGTLSGLPSGLTAVDLLVTIGV